MARWAGDGKDWIQLMMHSHLRSEDVIRHLLQSTKQPVDKKKESKGPVPTKKLDLGILVVGERPTLEIKGDNKTIVDWVNDHAKMKTRVRTVEIARNFLYEIGGVEKSAYDSEPESGSRTPSPNTTKKPTCGLMKVRKGVYKNGWTPPVLLGQKLPVSVGFGTRAVTTAIVEVAL